MLGRPHGIRGDIYFRPHNPQGRAFDDVRGSDLVHDGQRRRYEVTSMRPVADAYVAHLAGVDDREAAAALTLAEVRVARAACRRSGRASTSSRTSSAARSRTRTARRWAS